MLAFLHAKIRSVSDGGLVGKRSVRLVVAPKRHCPDIGRRRAVATAKAVVEMRQVREARLEGDGADRAQGKTIRHQQPMRTRQTRRQDKVGEIGAFALEHGADIALGYLVARGQRVDAEVARSEVGSDIVLDGAQPGRAHAAVLRCLMGVVCGARAMATRS